MVFGCSQRGGAFGARISKGTPKDHAPMRVICWVAVLLARCVRAGGQIAHGFCVYPSLKMQFRSRFSLNGSYRQFARLRFLPPHKRQPLPRHRYRAFDRRRERLASSCLVRCGPFVAHCGPVGAT